MRLGILGGGSWGTALAILWATKGHEVTLWVRNPDNARRFREAGRNTRYLPDHPFPSNLTIATKLEETVRGGELICLAVPLQAYRSFLDRIAGFLEEDQRLLLLSKGIELETWRLPNQIITDVLGEPWKIRNFTLSGPSFAKEVAENKPTTVVLTGRDRKSLRELQAELNAPFFRMYRNQDVIGVELAGALKNVIAIACGITRGLDLGYNAMAGLITRGLAEISRLGVALGAKRETFAGLAGMGDLILTCTGSLSRNLRVGQELARGKTLEVVLQELGMVAEGVHTARSAHGLGQKLGVELPITDGVHAILYDNLSPVIALKELMSRDLKSETK